MKWFFSILFLTAIFSISHMARADDTIDTSRFHDGDLIFVDLECGELCDAIESSTKAQFQVDGPNLSHVGILAREDGQWVVYEAWNGVERTPLATFLGRPKTTWYIKRPKMNQKQIAQALDKARSQVGKPYDETFKKDNGKYYCSELVAESYNSVRRHNRFFMYRPMYFGEPGKPDDQYWQTWWRYFHEREMAVPSGEPGISPLGIYLSPHLKPVR